KPKGQGPSPEPSPPAPQTPPTPDPSTAQAAANAPQVAMNNSATLPRPQPQPNPNQQTGARSAPPPGGALGEALKNLNRYAQDQQLDNPNGGKQGDPANQMHSKGVVLGPLVA